MRDTRVAPVLLALAATACAAHSAREPRLDPAVYSALCQPVPDPETAKHGGCVLKDQGLLRTLPATTRQPGPIVRPPQQ